MSKRILGLLAAAAIFASGSAMGATQGMGSGMMSGHGPGMMYAAAPATQAGPYAPVRRGYAGMGRYRGYGRYGMGPSMMGGYGHYGMGPGMMGGFGHYGMGPGMMGSYGGYGMGPGMMGGYGGYGMGPGMMGGYGHYGMMYGYGARTTGLSPKQRERIAGIWNQAMQQAWPIMGQLREQHFQLTRLMDRENPDRASVDKVYDRMSDLRRKLLDYRLEAHRQMLQVLTAKQRKQLQQGFSYPEQ